MMVGTEDAKKTDFELNWYFLFLCGEYWGLMRGFATLLPRCIQEPLVVRDRDGRPLAVHRFCVCSGSALLGDLLGVSRSVECDFLFVLSYSGFFFSVYFVPYVKWLAGKTLLRTPINRGDCRHKHQAVEHFCVFFCQFGLLFDCVFVRGPIQYILYMHGTI